MTVDPARQTYPNFFVVGAPRSGTTVLDQALRRHPEVFMCSIKEPNYFAKDVDSFSYLTENGFNNVDVRTVLAATEPSHHFAAVERLDDYLALFQAAHGAKAIGECSTSYMLSECAAEEIHAAVPHARIIMILRNPVSRAQSHYRMIVAQGLFHGTIAEAIDRELKQDQRWAGVISSSLYLHQVERFLNQFDRSKVFIALSEDLDDWPAFAANLARFLDIDPRHFPAVAPRVNESRAPRFPALNYWTQQLGVLSAVKPLVPQSLRQSISRMYFRAGRDESMPESVRENLVALFEPEVRGLAPLIGRDLSYWLEAGRRQSQTQDGELSD